MLRLFNTLGRRKEEFMPMDDQNVKMYACGPTVYDSPHLGNLRTFIVVDTLRRFLILKGFRVTEVMNITDIDDKTIRRSRSEGIPLRQYTEKYTEAFFSDIDKLGIMRADAYPKASQHIDEMVGVIKRLKEAGYAYQSNGSTYFSISKLKTYGNLSGARVGELSSVNRVSEDEYGKEHAHDFALWKGWVEEDGEIYWDTELGRGRPGWHIECSAMSMKFLGKSFDIHVGGVDLIFPHHENEIAQSEAVSGARFVRYWIHVEHLIVEGKKMAKSLGNFYTLGDLTRMGYDYSSIRYLLLSSHYRDRLNFTFEGLRQAKESVKRLQDMFQRLGGPMQPHRFDERVAEDSTRFMKEFEDALDDDLNMPSALAVLFDYVRKTNRYLDDGTLSEGNREEIVKNLKRVDSILGLIVPPVVHVTAELGALLERREKARIDGDWALADDIRGTIESSGFRIEDTPYGPKLKRV